MATEALVVYNPAAGRSILSPDRLERLCGSLRDIGVVPELKVVEPGHRQEILTRLHEKELLIICGGDGTIHDVLPSAISASVPVAILPTGTANVLARELGIPRNLDKAIELIKQGRRQTLRLGRANGRYFHLMAGVGADGYIIDRVGLNLKRFLGVAAYWITGITKFWSYPMHQFRVDIGDRTYSATFAVISNARYYGGHLVVAPYASVFEDGLDVCLLTSKNHLRFLGYLWGSLRGRYLRYSDVVYKKTRQLDVVGDQRIHVQLDGELAGFLPMTFSTSESQLQVVAP